MVNNATATPSGIRWLTTSASKCWSRLNSQPTLLPLVCCTWLFIACLWLTVEPRYSMRLPGLEFLFVVVPIAISLFLIACVTWDAFMQLLRHGQHQIVIGDVCFLLMLFTIVFMQLSTHSDALHFSHDFVASPWDWFLFSFGNALRAADLADVLKDFGVYVPQITAQSWTACSLLIGYRLIIDILFLSFALVTVKRIGEWLVETLTDSVSETIVMQLYFLSWVALIACWTFTALWWSPWQRTDLALWPLDNLLRVFDIFDGMQIFGVRLDSIPNGPAEVSLGIAFRVLVAVALAKPVDWLQQRFVRTVKRCLSYFTQKQSQPTPAEKLESSWDLQLAVCGVATLALGLFVVTTVSKATHKSLVETATTAHDADAYRVIRRLGINCAPNTMRALHAVAADQDQGDDERLQAISTLGHFGIASVDLIAEVLRLNPTLRDGALHSLVEVGPSSSPALITVLEECDPKSRDFAIATLKAWGGDAVSYLASSVDADNAVYFYTLFDSIDPYWYGRRGSGGWFKKLVHSKKCCLWLTPAVNRLFNDSVSIAESRARGQAIQAIVAQMQWTPPPVAEALMRVVAFRESLNYGEMRHDWNEAGRRASTYGGPVPHGASAETDGIRQAVNHLITSARKNPESAIDVFLGHLNSESSLDRKSAKICLQRVCGGDYVQVIHGHRQRGIQGRAFHADTTLAIRQWSAPDLRQILIDSGLPTNLEVLIPVGTRDQLSADDARDLLEILRSRADQVWIDILAEIGKHDYPNDVAELLVAAGASHPAREVRMTVCDHYPRMQAGPDLIRKHVLIETDEQLMLRLLEVAAQHEGLAQSIASLTEKFAETSSNPLVSAAADVLVTARAAPQFAHLANGNELFRDQLLDRIDSIRPFSDVEDAYYLAMKAAELTDARFQRLTRALANQEHQLDRNLVAELFGYQNVAARQFAIEQLLSSGAEGQELLFQLLSNETDHSRIESHFAAIRKYIHHSQSGLLSDDAAVGNPDDESIPSHNDPSTFIEGLTSTLLTDNAELRLRAVMLINDLRTSLRRTLLKDLYAHLKVEANSEVRRAILDLLAGTPPNGIKGVIAWRQQESDQVLNRHLNDLIQQHRRETARIAEQKQQQMASDKAEVATLVSMLKDASTSEAQELAAKLSDFGNLVVGPLDQLLRDQDLKNQEAIDVAVQTLQAVGPKALPTLSLHARNPNAFVWRKALNAMFKLGAPAEPHLRKLLSQQRPVLQNAVLGLLEKRQNLDVETLRAVLPLLTVEASGVDLAALSVLKRDPEGRQLLREVGQDQRIRSSLRRIINEQVATAKVAP